MSEENATDSDPLRILVLGGLGRVARAFIFLALGDEPVPRIAVFDSSPSSNGGGQPPLPEPVVRLPQRSLEDLDDGGALFSNYDVVVNALPVSLSEDVLAMAARSGCAAYVDVSSDGLETPEQLAYSEQFARQGRLLLSGVGVAPGLDNLLVAELVERFGAAWVRIYLVEHSTDETYVPSWCEEDAAISSADKPVSYDGHKLRHHEPFDSPQELRTSAGKFKFYRYFGEEVVSLAHNYPTLRIDHRAGGHEVEVARDMANGKEVPVASSAGEPHTKEPEGVFGVKILSDVGTAEAILKTTAQLRAEGLPGNHISYHTGAMLYYCLKHALRCRSPKLTGTMFPENLPASVRAAILKEVKAKLATHFTLGDDKATHETEL